MIELNRDINRDFLTREGSESQQLVEDSPGGNQATITNIDPRAADLKRSAEQVEQKIREQAREAMKDPSKDIDQINSGLKGEVKQARKTALQWLSEGSNFWIVAAIVLFLIWRK